MTEIVYIKEKWLWPYYEVVKKLKEVMRKFSYLDGYLDLFPVGVKQKKSCIKSLLLKTE